MRVFVTGANGFVGVHLCQHLLEQGHEVIAGVRTPGAAPAGTQERVIGDIGATPAWDEVLAGCEAIVHLAARVHVMNDTAADPLLEFRRVNTSGTETLARAAAKAGVKRFVFLSSIKVNGEITGSVPFTSQSSPKPLDAYGISKFEAETALRAIALESDLEVVVVRTPLVYGPGVGGNFARIVKLVLSGTPLPLGSIQNKRTMCSVWNLSDLLGDACVNAEAKNSVIIAGDDYSPSTPELIRGIAKANGQPTRVFPFPIALLRIAGTALGQSSTIDRLVDSLEVQAGSCTNGWNWRPPRAFDESLAETVASFTTTPARNL